MSSHLDLASFLQDQSDDGVKDSEGDFTISHKNARRKLAKFALPRKYAWASKLVQAAVGWKMETVLLAQSRAETQFFFHTTQPSKLPTESDIVNTLLSGKVVADSPIEHFCLALRALVEQSGLSFIVVFNDGEVLPKPIYAGRYYGEISEAERLSHNYSRGIGVTLTVRHASGIDGEMLVSHLIKFANHGLPIVDELQTYCYTSPVPIVLEGRHLEGILNAPDLSAKQVPLVLGGLKRLDHAPLLLMPPSFESKKLSFLTHPRRARRNYGGERDFHCVYLVSALDPKVHNRSARRCTLNWVRDGVVVQTTSLNIETMSIALSVYLSADGLRSDLTGFQLVDEPEKTAREREALKRLSAEMPELSGNVYDFFKSDTDDQTSEDQAYDHDQDFRSRVKTLVRSSAAGLLLTLVNPPFGTIATIGSMVGTYGTRIWSNDENPAVQRKPQVAEALRNDLSLLQSKLSEDATGLTGTLAEIDLDELDPHDSVAMQEVLESSASDPAALIETLREQLKNDLDEPLWNLYIARAYGLAGQDNRATIFLNRYLDKRPDQDVYEELAQLYEKLDKASLADLVRWKSEQAFSKK